MILKYVNHNGQEISLYDRDIAASATELLSWASDKLEINKHIVGYIRKERSRTIPCAIANRENALALRDKIYKIAAVDTTANRYGRIYFDDWYILANITGIEYPNWWHNAAMLELEILEDGTGWHRDKDYIFSDKETTAGGFDYPFDYMFDYRTTFGEASVYNAGVTGADFILRIDGPVTNPSVTIGDNIYRVDTQVLPGERLEVNSIRHTVELVTAYGSRVNKFQDVKGEFIKGSGTYIFEPIALGYNSVQWNERTHTGITVIEQSEVLQWI